MFFFEKKNQKTFVTSAVAVETPRWQIAKVCRGLFSRKNIFCFLLSWTASFWLIAAAPDAGLETQISYVRGRVAAEAAKTPDPRRRAEILRNDAAWWRWQAGWCGARIVAERRPECMRETLAIRRAVIDAQRDGAPPAVSKYCCYGSYEFPKAPPDDWWGKVLWSSAHRPPGTTFQIKLLLDRDKNLKVMTSSAGLKWDASDSVLINAFDRRIEQTYASMKDIFDYPSDKIMAQHGFSLVYPGGGNSGEPAFIQRISSNLDISTASYGCMNELSFQSWYFLHDEHEKMDEGRGWHAFADLAGVHIFERFAKPETRVFYGKCETTDRATLTTDFLPMPFQFYGRFPDGTLLAAVGSLSHGSLWGEKFLVRFRPDMTSPFFYGWKRLFLVQDTFLPELWAAGAWADRAAVTREVDRVLDEVEAEQSP